MNEPLERATDLTPIQRKSLQQFRDYLTSPPTMTSLLAKRLPGLLFVVFYFGFLAASMLYLDMEEWGLVIAGIGIGIVFHTVSALRVFTRIWPAMEVVIDRNRLDDLIDEPPVDNDPRDN